MSKKIVAALEEIESEKGISRDTMCRALEAALVSAYRKHYGISFNVEAKLDPKRGKVKLIAEKTVVDKVEEPLLEISLEDARVKKPKIKLGDAVKIETPLDDFGRIAAQTAMQVVVQRMREAERNLLYEEYLEKKGEMMNGIVQRRVNTNVFVNIGKLEALLPRREQVPNEEYQPGDRVKIFVVDVKESVRGPRVLVSRSSPMLIQRLFELEVPEVFEKIVEIKAIAREAGTRTKLAVSSNLPNVDPLGACVGARSSRIQAIVRELGGEKIDIVIWSDDTVQFIKNSLSPAKVNRVILDESERTAHVLVADDQLSLAIGKRGQNARLAARLTDWRIDVQRESEYQAKEEQKARMEAQKLFQRDDDDDAGPVRDITQIDGVGPKLAEKLRLAGYGSIEGLLQATPDEIKAVPGIGAKTADKIVRVLEEIADSEA